MMHRAFAAACLTTLLGGCFQHIDELNSQPKLSPLGAGLTPNSNPISTMPATSSSYVTKASLWQDTGADSFQGPARR